MATEPTRYTWNDEYKDVDVAAEYAQIRESAEQLAALTKVTKGVTERTLRPITQIISALTDAQRKIDGFFAYQESFPRYERDMSYYRKQQEKEAAEEAKAAQLVESTES